MIVEKNHTYKYYKKYINKQYVFLFLLLLHFVVKPIEVVAQNSVLSTGKNYKIALTQTGVFKMDANFLKKAGIDINSFNPQNLKIYGNGGGTLPQGNNIKRINDLIENTIYVEGENDGKFDVQDYILFYGESPHQTKYDSITKKMSHQLNIYSDTTFYFLQISDGQGLRVKDQNSISGSKTITSFDDFMFHEVEQTNIIASGREWYGEYFGLTSEQSFIVNTEGILKDSSYKITSSVMSVAQVNTKMLVKLNNQTIGTHQFQAIGNGRYDIKGNNDLQTFSIKSDGNATQKITYSYNGLGQASSGAYLNYFQIQAKRQLQYYKDQTVFRSIESIGNLSTNFQILQANSETKIWEVTNPQKPINQTFQVNNQIANFGVMTKGILKTFILFGNSNLFIPNSIQAIQNQNLHNLQTPDLLIVTPKLWQNQAEKLANFRRKNDSLSVLVVTNEAINNEFASGRLDVSAIRDFGRFLWQKNTSKLKYILLFGDASFDYKGHLGIVEIKVNNLIPVYESRESLNPLYSYSSDDYFGFFQETAGEWTEDYNSNYTLDVGIGRLPIKTETEAEGVVNKLIYYATQKKTEGQWRDKISFVADDGDDNIHQISADTLAQSTFSMNNNVILNKIYVDAFSRVGTGSAVKAPKVNEAIGRAVNEGSLIVNYTGHGGTIGWAEEQILTIGDIINFKNLNNMPLFVTATCEFGQYDNPTLVSGAELAILNRNGGAIGLLTTTRPVFSNTNFLLNSAFYEAAFSTKNKQLPRLGEIMKRTKNNSLNGVNNRNFALLGDPSMALNYPTKKIKLTKINGNVLGKDTLKALAKITLEGQIIQDSTFNGTVFVSVFDKPSKIKTLGLQGNNPMEYEVYKNQIFDGKATVKNGAFKISFIVPKDIVYTYGKGRIHFYASNADSTLDANGNYNDIVVGGSLQNIKIDSTSPRVQLMMNNSNFKLGGTVGRNSIFIANIADENGINISEAGIGHEIILTINDTLQISVNDYFTSTSDDFTKGVLLYPLTNLALGKYTVKLKVWDVYNNSTEQALDFVVEEEKFRLSNVYNFPNPFDNQTTFYFQQNRLGDDLGIEITIFDGLGRTVNQIVKNYYHADTILNDLTIDGNNLLEGTYFYRIFARSLSENLQAYTFGKLIYRK